MNVRDISKLALKFLFRRIDYVGKAFYLLIVESLRELAAIGFDDAIAEGVAYVKNLPELQGNRWMLIAVDIAKIPFSGSWVSFSIVIALLAFVGFLKYKSRDVVKGVKHHFNAQLRHIDNMIQNFKSSTAVELLQKFFEALEDSYVSREEVVPLQAKAHFLLGLAKSADDGGRSGFKSAIISYELQPSEVKYKERACTSYFFLDQKNIAKNFAAEILQQDALNERAHFVLFCTDEAHTLDSIPLSVKNGLTFKRLYFNSLIKDIDDGRRKALILFEPEIKTMELPALVDFNNIDYWDGLARFVFFIGITNQPNDFPSVKEDYKNNNLVKYANALLKIIHSTIKGKEDYDRFIWYPLISFKYYYSEYLLKDDASAVQQMFQIYNDHFSSKGDVEDVITSLLICLHQVRRYEDVLKLSDKLPDDDDFKHLIRYQAYQSKGKMTEAMSAFQLYFKRHKSITDAEVNNILVYSDYLLQNKQSPDIFYDECLKDKIYETEIQENLLYSYLFRYDNEKKDKIAEYLTLFVNSYDGLRHDLRVVALIILHTHKQYDTVISLINKYHNWKTERPVLEIYTESQLAVRNDSEKLFEALSFRRKKAPKEDMFFEEIRLYDLIGDTETILTICREGMALYPSNENFRAYYILSLFKLKRDAELEKELTNDLLNRKFNSNQKFTIARICIDRGKKLLGLELFYREVMANPKPIVKQHYFMLTTTIGDRHEIEWPAIVSLDTWVDLQVGSERILLLITESSLKENPIAQAALGLKQNDNSEFFDKMLGLKIPITAVQIFDKYSGLAKSIIDEINKSDYTGMDIRSIKLDGTSPESFVKTLRDKFGEVGDKEKIRKDLAFKSYYNHDISFSELVSIVSKDKVLEMYSLLTSNESDGFHIIPIRDFNSVQLKRDAEYVIDFTSLPILVQLSEKGQSLSIHKFVVSSFMIQILEDELEEAEQMSEGSMSIKITSSTVTPIFIPTGYRDHAINTLKRLLNWINAYCVVGQSKDKVDMIIKHPDLIKDDNRYLNYLMDVAFISNKRILISDDYFHHKTFASHYPTISLEYYLKFFYPEQFTKMLLPVLIQNHYIGLTLNSESLKAEFSKPVFGKVDTFRYCLENLPFPVNHDSSVFPSILDFVKFIYTESIPLDKKKEISRQVLYSSLKGYPHLLKLHKNLLNEIHVKFQLLPLQLNEVLDDFNSALDILNSTV